MNKKSIKVTTKQQFEKLLQLMEQNPDIGRGKVAFGENKNDRKGKWNIFSEELNSLGPPFRTGSEWQRVWIHFKAKTKKKLANNRRNVLATGGGPSEEIPLSALEESVANMVEMTRQIVPEGQVFGIENIEPSPEGCMPVIEETEIPSGNKRVTATARKRNFEHMNLEQQRLQLLQQQIETQKKLLEKMSKLEKTCYKQYLLSKEKFEFQKRKAAKEEELVDLQLEYQRKRLKKLEEMQ